MKRYFIGLFLIIISIVFFHGCKDDRVRTLSVDSSDVALISIVADDGKKDSNIILRNYGHAFLVIENISQDILVIGDREVLPLESITIGLWNIKEHFGIWYNIESNYISEYNKYRNRVLITIGINLEDIDSINSEIRACDKWTPIFNCSTFATKLWNLVAEEDEKINDKLLLSPSYLVKEITKFKGHERQKEIITNKNIFYYGEGILW